MPKIIYEQIREFILTLVRQRREVTFSELLEAAQQEPAFEDYEANLNWYLLKVKQDLEAKRIIRVRRSVGLSRAQFITINKTAPRRRLS